MAQRLNNADDKNGNEDDPRPKKELGRQISQRAWQMVRSSKKKKKKPGLAQIHKKRNSLAAENPFTSLNLDVSLILFTAAFFSFHCLVSFDCLYVLSLSVCCLF
jgi:hypothetical protein